MELDRAQLLEVGSIAVIHLQVEPVVPDLRKEEIAHIELESTEHPARADRRDTGEPRDHVLLVFDAHEVSVLAMKQALLGEKPLFQA